MYQLLNCVILILLENVNYSTTENGKQKSLKPNLANILKDLMQVLSGIVLHVRLCSLLLFGACVCLDTGCESDASIFSVSRSLLHPASSVI